MTALSAVTDGQAAAESLMLDTCTITAPSTSKGTLNETTLQYDGGTPGATVYSGKCKVQIPSPGNQGSEAIGGVWSDFEIRVDLPVTGSEAVVKHCIVTINSAAVDSALVNRQFTVDGQFHKTFPTARRLRCREGV